MKLIQCSNHHYYDSDQYSVCPYCGHSYDKIKPREEVIIVPPAEYDEEDTASELNSSEEKMTVSYFTRVFGMEPVVGWLVAVGGMYFGEDFRLKEGRNFIGRAPEMDIQLSLDTTVSRRRHAIIVYEPRSRVFYAQPGDSRELFYVNDKVVLSVMELHDRDVLTIGNTRLMLVTLCGDGFRWEDLKEEME